MDDCLWLDALRNYERDFTPDLQSEKLRILKTDLEAQSNSTLHQAVLALVSCVIAALNQNTQQCYDFARQSVMLLHNIENAPLHPAHPSQSTRDTSPGIILRYVFHAFRSSLADSHPVSFPIGEARSLALYLLTPLDPTGRFIPAIEAENYYVDDWNLTQAELQYSSTWHLIVPNTSTSGLADFVMLPLYFELRRGGQGRGFIPLQHRCILPHERIIQNILDWATEELLYCRRDLDVTVRLAPDEERLGRPEEKALHHALRAPIYTAIRFLANRWQHRPNVAICFDWRDERDEQNLDEYVNWGREGHPTLMSTANSNGITQIIFYDDGGRQPPNEVKRPKIDWVQDVSLVDGYLINNEYTDFNCPVVHKQAKQDFFKMEKTVAVIHGPDMYACTYFALSVIREMDKANCYLYPIRCGSINSNRDWLEDAICQAIGILPGLHGLDFDAAVKKALAGQKFYLLLDDLNLDGSEKDAIVSFLGQIQADLISECRIFITTNVTNACETISESECFYIPKWDNEASIAVMTRQGFARKTANEWVHKNLSNDDIDNAKKIAEAMRHRLPGALPSLNQLSSLSYSEVEEQLRNGDEHTLRVYDLLRWLPSGADSEVLEWLEQQLHESGEHPGSGEISLTRATNMLRQKNLLESAAGGREKLIEGCLNLTGIMPSELNSWLGKERIELLRKRCAGLFTERSRQTRRFLSGQQNNGEIKNIDAYLKYLDAARDQSPLSDDAKVGINLCYMRLLAPYHALGIHSDALKRLEEGQNLANSVDNEVERGHPLARIAQTSEAFFFYYIGEYFRRMADYPLARFHYYNAYFIYQTLMNTTDDQIDTVDIPAPLRDLLLNQPAAGMGALRSIIKHAICFRCEGDNRRAVWWFTAGERLIGRTKTLDNTDTEKATILRQLASIIRRRGYLHKDDHQRDGHLIKMLVRRGYIQREQEASPDQEVSPDIVARMLSDAEQIFRQYGDLQGQGECLFTLGEVRRAQGIYTAKDARDRNVDTSALEYFTVALQKYRKLAIYQNIADVYRVCGEVFWRLDSQMSRYYIEVSKNTYIRYGNRLGRAHLWRLQAEVQRMEIHQLLQTRASAEAVRACTKEAKDFLHKSAFLYIQMNMPIGFFKARKGMGDLLREQGQYHEALAYYRDAYGGLKDFQDEIAKAECEHGLGQTLLHLDEFAEAEEKFAIAAAFFRKANMKHLEQQCLRDLANCREEIVRLKVEAIAVENQTLEGG